MSRLIPTANELKKLRILVVGDAMLDQYWIGKVERISPEAPVPVLQKESEDNRLGGAANVALNLRSLGVKTTLLSVLGLDDAGAILNELLEKHQINLIKIDSPTLKTTVKLRIMSRAQQIIRIDSENRPQIKELVEMSKQFSDLVRDHDAVIFSDYNKGSLENISDMIKVARGANIPILVDPKRNNWSVYSNASVITPNLNELAQVIGKWSDEVDLETKIQILRSELKIEAVCLTRSEHGIKLFEFDKFTSIMSHANEVVDVTGAGDTVIANLAIMLASGRSLRDAAIVANLAAGKVVKKSGTASLSYKELCE